MDKHRIVLAEELALNVGGGTNIGPNPIDCKDYSKITLEYDVYTATGTPAITGTLKVLGSVSEDSFHEIGNVVLSGEDNGLLHVDLHGCTKCRVFWQDSGSTTPTIFAYAGLVEN
jgi:hypothetical protein